MNYYKYIKKDIFLNILKLASAFKDYLIIALLL